MMNIEINKMFRKYSALLNVSTEVFYTKDAQFFSSISSKRVQITTTITGVAEVVIFLAY